MAMSDCIKCWDTPCVCGWGYRHMDKESRLKQASTVLGVELEKLTKKVGDFVPKDHPMKYD